MNIQHFCNDNATLSQNKILPLDYVNQSEMSVTWSQNGSGQYLVESKEHLLQLMHNGTLYTDAGTPPADYWASSYLQTSDIDLANDEANIALIGNDASDFFSGEYDGGLLSIANWKFSGSTSYTGLFGYCTGATLKRMRLSGVWVLNTSSTSKNYTGFLTGWLNSSHAYDIDANFSTGTTLTQTDPWFQSLSGTMIGLVNEGSVSGLSVRGTVDFQGSCYKVGGVVGSLSQCAMSQCRNLATYPSGITGYRVGGIVGYSYASEVSRCLNAMTGDLVSTNVGGEETMCMSGGICGYVYGSVDFVVNSMTGNVTSEEYAGGIVGWGRSTADPIMFTKLCNYMTGDVSGSENNSGGLIGYHYVTTTNAIRAVDNCVVAMSGTVEQPVCGRDFFNAEFPPTYEVYVDRSFGMSTTGTDYESPNLPVDDELVYNPGFGDLPYFEFGGTDADGNVYSWDFIFGNLSTKYPEYTHLSMHTATVSAPYYTDFGLGENNDTVYLTYSNVTANSVHHDPSLTVVTTEATATTILQQYSDISKSDFIFSDGNVYDITEADAEVAGAVNEIFDTGDAVAVTVNNAATTTTFVNRGDQLDVAEVNAVLLPFDPAITDAQQQATLQLSDETTIDVSMDQASGQILVDGVMYSAGDYFVMDGRKVTVVDI